MKHQGSGIEEKRNIINFNNLVGIVIKTTEYYVLEQEVGKTRKKKRHKSN